MRTNLYNNIVIARTTSRCAANRAAPLFIVIAGLGFTNTDVYAQDITFTGVTGPLTTPNALIATPETLVYQFNNHVESRFESTTVGGRNHVFTLGAFKRLEVGGRLTDFDPIGERVLENGIERGKRDLSGNAKLKIYSHSERFSLSVGAIDFGGQAQNFESYYGVASATFKNFEISAGLAEGNNPSFNGAFANARYDVNRYLSLASEVDTSGNFNVGLTGRAALSPRLSINATLGNIDSETTAGIGFTYGLRAPTFKPHTLRKSDTSAVSSASAESAAQSASTDVSARASENASGLQTTKLTNLADALANHGFQNIRLGIREDDDIVLEIENKLFVHSDYDALKQARFIVGETIGDNTAVDIALLEQGISKFRVRYANEDTAGVVLPLKATVSELNDTTWLVSPGSYNRSLADFTIEPQLVSAVGTEVGLVDYSLAARLGVSVPLWKGAQAVVKTLIPLAESDNFDTGGVFEPNAFSTTVERALLVQYLPLFETIHTQAELGQIDIRGFDYTAAKLQGAWDSQQWPIRLQATGGHYRLNNSNITRNVVTGTASYTANSLDTVFSATYGQFFFRDKGIKLDATRRFGNTHASVFINAISDDNLVGGLQLSTPFGPRKGWQWNRLTLTGASRWSHALQTTIEFPGANDNRIQTGFLIEPLLDSEIPLRILDSGRLNNYDLRLLNNQ